LADRERINQKLQEIIDQQTEPWGVKVRAVELKQIDLPHEMQRVMAKQAEYEADIDIFQVASDNAVEAVVDGDDLRRELILRYALYRRRDPGTYERRNGVYPV